MSYDEQSDRIAGTIGLLKQYVSIRALIHSMGAHTSFRRRYVTRTGRETAEDATLLCGGRRITQTGMGKVIENVRTARHKN